MDIDKQMLVMHERKRVSDFSDYLYLQSHFKKHGKLCKTKSVGQYLYTAKHVVEHGAEIHFLREGIIARAFTMPTECNPNIFHFVAVDGDQIKTYYMEGVSKIRQLCKTIEPKVKRLRPRHKKKMLMG